MLWKKHSLTPRSRVFLRTLTAPQLDKKFITFLSPEASLSYSQYPVTSPYPESDEFTEYHLTCFFKIPWNIKFSPTTRAFRWSLSFLTSPSKSLYTFFFSSASLAQIVHPPWWHLRIIRSWQGKQIINPLNPELNPICYLLALLAHHFLHVSRIRVKSLTIRLLMSYIYIYIYIYIYGAPILDVSRSHTTTHHSR